MTDRTTASGRMARPVAPVGGIMIKIPPLALPVVGRRPSGGTRMGTNGIVRGSAARRGRVWRRSVAVLLAMGLLFAACGDDNGDSNAATNAAPGATTAATTTTVPPQTGGTITFGEFSEPVGLDP